MNTVGTKAGERGMVLVSSMLMLVVVTLLAIGLFRSFGLDEKIAGNTREKQRALQAAVSAEQFAEWWLINGAATLPVVCTAGVTSASVTVGQICTNSLPSANDKNNVAALPWTIGGADVTAYYPMPNLPLVGTGSYYKAPGYYISYLGTGTAKNTLPGSMFQIDAVGYGGSPSTAVVVESTFVVQVNSVSCKDVTC